MFSILLASILLAVEVDPAVDPSVGDSARRMVQESLVSQRQMVQVPSELARLPGVESALRDAGRHLEEGVRLYLDLELSAAQGALDQALSIYAKEHAEFWADAGLVKTLLYRALVAIAMKDDPKVDEVLGRALSIDPRLELNAAQYPPELIERLTRVRVARREVGFAPAPAEVWGAQGRLVGADRLVLGRLARSGDGVRLSLRLYRVEPHVMSLKTQNASNVLDKNHVDRLVAQLLSESGDAAPYWKRWEVWAAAGGSAVAVVGAAVLLLVPRVTVTAEKP